MQTAVKENTCEKCKKIRTEIYICLNCRSTMCFPCSEKHHAQIDVTNHRLIDKRNNSFEYNYGYQLPVSYFSSDFYKTQEYSRDIYAQKILETAIRILFKNTRIGNPMMLLDDLVIEISYELNISKEKIAKFLDNELHCSLINQTTRFFGDLPALKYFSLCLNYISVESLIWILKSIRNDKMQPNESLMFSRFKEYFSIKILMKEWKQLIESLIKSPELMNRFNKYKDIFGEIEIKEIEEGNYLFLLKGVPWIYEDLSVVTDSDEDYQVFLSFINAFFSEEPKDISKRQQEKVKWMTSVNNGNKNPSNISIESSYKKILQNESITKAIPGGKYGCTLLVKNCGQKILQQLSIGRIYSLIKHALNNQVIQHLKTHIVKNDPKISSHTKNLEEQIYELQVNIVKLLEEQENEEVTLAQLPLLLQKKYHKFYNIHDLGFPKLKNFLQKLENQIELTRSSNNHIKVSLRKKPKEAKLNSLEKLKLQSRESSEDKETEMKNGMNMTNSNFLNCEKYKKPHPKKHHLLISDDFESQMEFSKSGKKEPNETTTRELVETFQKIEGFLLYQVHRSIYGVEAVALEHSLSYHLGYQFNPEMFKSKNFVDFLKTNFQNSLDVCLKNSLKSKKSNSLNKPEYVVFAKKETHDSLGAISGPSFEGINHSKSEKQGSFTLVSSINLLSPTYTLVTPSHGFNKESNSIYSKEHTEKIVNHVKSKSHIGTHRAKEDINIEKIFDITNDHIFLNFGATSQIDHWNRSKENSEDEEEDKDFTSQQKKIINDFYDD